MQNNVCTQVLVSCYLPDTEGWAVCIGRQAVSQTRPTGLSPESLVWDGDGWVYIYKPVLIDWSSVFSCITSVLAF